MISQVLAVCLSVSGRIWAEMNGNRDKEEEKPRTQTSSWLTRPNAVEKRNSKRERKAGKGGRAGPRKSLSPTNTHNLLLQGSLPVNQLLQILSLFLVVGDSSGTGSGVTTAGSS